MQFGSKKARYAIINHEGNPREVIGAILNDKNVEYTKPDSLVQIKNNGTTSNDVTYKDTGADGSYIVKNDEKAVSDFGWLDGTTGKTVAVPAGETAWTHGQETNNNTTIVTIANGQFEVVDWSNCTNDKLGAAFESCYGLKKVPSTYPENTSFLYRTFKNDTLDSVPDWDNASNVTDVREMFNGTTINDEIKLPGMISALTNVTTCKKFLNNCKIAKYTTYSNYYFYYLYKMLKNKCDDTTGYQMFGSSDAYRVKFNFTDSDGTSTYVIPPDLMFIPSAWGGYLESTYGYVTVEDNAFSKTGIKYTNHIDWNLSTGYKTITESDGSWVLSDVRSQYYSCYTVIENHGPIGSGYEQTHYYIKKGSSAEIDWGGTLPNGTYQIKIHVYMACPDSTIPPTVSDDGTITTDYAEVFLKDGASYRGDDGVYTRTFDVGYDITTCTITITNPSQGDTALTWEVYNSDGYRIDDSSDPPDNYIVTLTNSTTSEVYTYASVTSPTVPLYNMESGVCTDSSGADVTNIPDGTYVINVTAYKDSNSCNKNATISIENWASYWDATVTITINPDNELEWIWTVADAAGNDITGSLLKTGYWLYNSTGTCVKTGMLYNDNTFYVGDYAAETYHIDIKAYSKDNTSRAPSTGVVTGADITVKSDSLILSEGTTIAIQYTPTEDTVLTSFGIITSKTENTSQYAIFDADGYLLYGSSNNIGTIVPMSSTDVQHVIDIRTKYGLSDGYYESFDLSSEGTITLYANKTYYIVGTSTYWGSAYGYLHELVEGTVNALNKSIGGILSNTFYPELNGGTYLGETADIIPYFENMKTGNYYKYTGSSTYKYSQGLNTNRYVIIQFSQDFLDNYNGSFTAEPTDPVEGQYYFDSNTAWHKKWSSTDYYNGNTLYKYENGAWSAISSEDDSSLRSSSYSHNVNVCIVNSTFAAGTVTTTNKGYLEINGAEV